MMRLARGLAIVTSLLVLAPSVEAQIPPVVRSGTHPMWASFSFGPAIGIRDGEFDVSAFGGTYEVDYPTPDQLKLVQSFGYHFSGNASGPAIALDLQESVGDDHFLFELVPRFLWDIPVVSGLGFYLSPSFGFGYVYGEPDDCDDCSGHGFTLQFAFEGKLVLADRALIFFRPVCIDVMPINAQWGNWDDWITPVRYELLVGGGAIF
jgi:hypothetical protein